jgi:hypothetical protein
MKQLVAGLLTGACVFFFYGEDQTAHASFSYSFNKMSCEFQESSASEKMAFLDKLKALGGLHKAYTAVTGNPSSITPSAYYNGTSPLPLSDSELKNHCFVVFGGPEHVDDSVQMTFKNGKEYSGFLEGGKPLYLGFDENGELFLNPYYPEWYAGDNLFSNPDFFFYRAPWKTYPSTTTLSNKLNNKLSDAALRSSFDKYSSDFFSHLHVINDSVDPDQSFISKNRDVSLLRDYIVVERIPTDYAPGYYKLFFSYKGTDSFTTVFVPSTKCFWCELDQQVKENHSFVCSASSLSWKGTPYEGENAALTLTLNHSFASKTAGSKSNVKHVWLTYGWINTGDGNIETYSKFVNVNENKETVVSLTDGNVLHPHLLSSSKVETLHYPKANRSGTATFIASINTDFSAPVVETSRLDNSCSWDIPLTKPENVSVSFDTNSNPALLYEKNKPLNIPIIVSNQTSLPVKAPCDAASSTNAVCSGSDTNMKIEVFDQSGVAVSIDPKYQDYTLPTVLSGGSKNVLFDESLPKGKYTIKATIPDYAVNASNETNSSDNSDSISITVDSIPPSNLDCRLLVHTSGSSHYVNSLKSDGLAKMCYGIYPNHPSTQIEGGTGTYAYMKYFFFPEPVPDYTVTNAGASYSANPNTRFFNQKVSLTEPKNVIGNQETYLYYPVQDSYNGIPVDQTTFPGPYLAGPHSFYHYMYRGRMIAESVDFDFEVTDPKSNVVAKGQVQYPIDTANCIRTDLIDYKESCREIVFYLPHSDETLFHNVPEDKEKIYYQNPGIHTFTFQATEHQRYYYQHDKGNEYQGKSGVEWFGNQNDPYGKKSFGSGETKTDAISSGTYTIRNEFRNHVERETDAFGVEKNVLCFHDHSKDFHFWKFDWSDVTSYSSPFDANWTGPLTPPIEEPKDNDDCQTAVPSNPSKTKVKVTKTTEHTPGIILCRSTPDSEWYGKYWDYYAGYELNYAKSSSDVPGYSGYDWFMDTSLNNRKPRVAIEIEPFSSTTKWVDTNGKSYNNNLVYETALKTIIPQSTTKAVYQSSMEMDIFNKMNLANGKTLIETRGYIGGTINPAEKVKGNQTFQSGYSCSKAPGSNAAGVNYAFPMQATWEGYVDVQNSPPN